RLAALCLESQGAPHSRHLRRSPVVLCDRCSSARQMEHRRRDDDPVLHHRDAGDPALRRCGHLHYPLDHPHGRGRSSRRRRNRRLDACAPARHRDRQRNRACRRPVSARAAFSRGHWSGHSPLDTLTPPVAKYTRPDSLNDPLSSSDSSSNRPSQPRE
ncbi:hypothetical protein KXV85_005317, partial [Aspergillus fumigatus]